MVAIIPIVPSRYLFLNLTDYFGVCPLGGLNNDNNNIILVSVDNFDPHGALKPQIDGLFEC